ncbi:MAG: type II toxin-antitoxin system VapC family toxin [Solirubrobacteraceae bacterium]
MILLDANLLVYAVNADAAQHGSARDWLDERLAGTARVGFPWPSLLAFLRIVTHPRIFSPPATVADAWAITERWLAHETAWVPQPTERHGEVLAAMLAQIPGGDLVPDAHLAALAVEHGLTLCSNDRDFARFEGLRWTDPLAAGR